MRKKTITCWGEAADHAHNRRLQGIVEPIDKEPDEQDDLDDPDRYPENSRDLQGSKERLFDDLCAPAGCFPGKGHESRDGQRDNPSGKEEDLEVVLHLFYLKRQDEDEEKDDQEPKVRKNVHPVHLF
jgi:hypothetical protein